MIDANPVVKIDQCHIDFIYGLLVAHKPGKVLEIGMGSGMITDVIIRAFDHNGIPLKLTCVDNWLDWDFCKPAEIAKYEDKGVLVTVSNEKDFVLSCREKYDLIISDADHYHSHEWFNRTLSLLKPNGLLICHDVTNSEFLNLRLVYRAVKWGGLPHFLFNKSSSENERCERGLLVVRGGSIRICFLAAFYFLRICDAVFLLKQLFFRLARAVLKKRSAHP